MTSYKIYANDGAGGAVDYSTPIGTTASLSFQPPALATPSDNTFAVRAYDTVSGLEELNTDCRIRIKVAADGSDITSRPNPVDNLSAVATANGGTRVGWTYQAARQGGAPTSFKVWLTAGASVNYAAAPATTVAYGAGMWTFSADLTGLADGTLYSIGVRATNASGDETNTLSVGVTGNVAGPDAVDGLSASAG